MGTADTQDFDAVAILPHKSSVPAKPNDTANDAIPLVRQDLLHEIIHGWRRSPPGMPDPVLAITGSTAAPRHAYLSSTELLLAQSARLRLALLFYSALRSLTLR